MEVEDSGDVECSGGGNGDENEEDGDENRGSADNASHRFFTETKLD